MWVIPDCHSSVLFQSSFLDYLKCYLFIFTAGLNIQSSRTLKTSKKLIPSQFLLFEAPNQVITCELFFQIGMIFKNFFNVWTFTQKPGIPSLTLKPS